MSDEPATWIGLFLSLFGVVIIRQAFRFFTPDMPVTAMAWRETLIWLIAAALLFLIRRGEGFRLTIEMWSRWTRCR